MQQRGGLICLVSPRCTIHTPHPRAGRTALLNHQPIRRPSCFLQLYRVLHLSQHLSEPRPSSRSLCPAAHLFLCCKPALFVLPGLETPILLRPWTPLGFLTLPGRYLGKITSIPDQSLISDEDLACRVIPCSTLDRCFREIQELLQWDCQGWQDDFPHTTCYRAGG